MMKRAAIAVLSLAIIIALVLEARHLSRQRAQTKREGEYQTVLLSYRQALAPGVNRREVEAYLRTKGVSFHQMCCVASSSPKRSWDELVKIGEEDAPFVCGEHNVYIAFQFIDHLQYSNSLLRADDLDKLSSVTIFHWLEGCL